MVRDLTPQLPEEFVLVFLVGSLGQKCWAAGICVSSYVLVTGYMFPVFDPMPIDFLHQSSYVNQ